MLGEQLANAGRLDEAVVQLQRAVDLGDTRARYQLGRVLLAKGDVTRQSTCSSRWCRRKACGSRCDGSSRRSSRCCPSRVLLGQIYATERRWPTPRRRRAQVLAKVPAHLDARRVLAASLTAQRRWAESITEHRLYLQSRPRDAQARVNLGIALIGAGQLDAAVSEFRLAVEAEPSNPNAQRLLALALEDQKQLAGGAR